MKKSLLSKLVIGVLASIVVSWALIGTASANDSSNLTKEQFNDVKDGKKEQSIYRGIG